MLVDFFYDYYLVFTILIKFNSVRITMIAGMLLEREGAKKNRYQLLEPSGITLWERIAVQGEFEISSSTVIELNCCSFYEKKRIFSAISISHFSQWNRLKMNVHYDKPHKTCYVFLSSWLERKIFDLTKKGDVFINEIKPKWKYISRFSNESWFNQSNKYYFIFTRWYKFCVSYKQIFFF